MKLSELLSGADILTQDGDPDIVGVQYDSRRVRPGDAFVAMRGELTDGNRYIDAAIKAGASAIATDSLATPARPGTAWVRMLPGRGRRVLAAMSANLNGHPAERLRITGVTGTNGKTTTTFLMEVMLDECGFKPALLGTIEYRIAGRAVPAPHTTPESLELNEFFSQALLADAKAAVMEVSSHALAQERVWGIPFEVAVFTNLTRDHLDFHKDMESYFAAKQRLFAGVGAPPPKVAVLNLDDENCGTLSALARKNGSQVITYGLKAGDFHAAEIEVAPGGNRFSLHSPAGKIQIESYLVGTVNVYNVLAAAAAASNYGCSLVQMRTAVARLRYVPGRFQKLDSGQPFTVIVDYAHTDDALRNLTAVAHDFVDRAATGGKVLTVFGCGGDRDRTKRPKMGEAAGRGSDFVILTSDNPRSEDPLRILHDSLPGLRATGCDFTIEPDRRRAIRLGVQLARPGDILLIAGKGHEKVQVMRDGEYPFDDVEVAREALYAAGFTEDFDKAMHEGIRSGGRA